jgi:hypothetical protein
MARTHRKNSALSFLGRRVIALDILMGWALAGTLTFCAQSTMAQTASEKAAAEALFDQGVKLLKAGDYAAACKKLERSQSVDPGIGTLLYLGECYKKLGRTASAWAIFREAASKAKAAGETERAEAGNSRADVLEPELSYLSFEVAAETMALPGLKVMRGNDEVSPALFGTKVPVDPGQLKVVATAPGHEPFEMFVQIQNGPAETTVSVPLLPALPPSERPASVAAGGPTTSDSRADQAPKPGSTQRGIGIAMGVLGVVGAGVGGVFGVLAINRDHKADEVCGDTTCNPGSDGYDLSSTARTYATVSTVAITAGAALAVGGVVLYFTAPKGTPKGSSSALTLEPTALTFKPTLGGAQVSFAGAF